MSNYEREYANIVLPTAEVAPLKQMLRDYQNKLRTEVRDSVLKTHKSINTRSLKLYKERMHQQRYDAADAQYAARNSFSRWSVQDTHRDLVTNIAGSVISRMLYRVEKEGIAPQQPTLADLDGLIPQATNKTTRFVVFDDQGYGEADISFQGRNVIWNVPENNRAVEHSREGEIGRMFFDRLGRIQWTRGTGGVGLYHSEYHEDDSPFGYANSISFDYGPLGEKVQAQRANMSVTKYRSSRASRAGSTRVGRW